MLASTTPSALLLLRHSPAALVGRRATHADIPMPNFDAYRHEMTKDPARPARETEETRKGMSTFVYSAVGGALTVLAGKQFLQKFAKYKCMPKDMAALASVEIDLTKVPEGKTKTFEFRGKPVFVRHRTAAEIAKERAVDITQLRDPERDEERCQRPEWSILIGVCTHLGCIPMADKGEFGGYFCPCHGSHYDASGRIRKGPAPLNLKVPIYEFKTDELVEIQRED